MTRLFVKATQSLVAGVLLVLTLVACVAVGHLLALPGLLIAALFAVAVGINYHDRKAKP